jgi:hypothetical protein
MVVPYLVVSHARDIGSGAVSTAKDVTSGDTPRFSIGDLKVTFD